MSGFPLPFRLHLDAAAVSYALLFSRCRCASVQPEPGQAREIRLVEVFFAQIRSRKYTFIFLG